MESGRQDCNEQQGLPNSLHSIYSLLCESTKPPNTHKNNVDGGICPTKKRKKTKNGTKFSRLRSPETDRELSHRSMPLMGRLDFPAGRAGVLGQTVNPRPSARGIPYTGCGCPPWLPARTTMARTLQLLCRVRHKRPSQLT